MAGDHVERKVRLTPRAAEIWDDFLNDESVTLSAVLEAIAELHEAELEGASVIERSGLTFTAWVDEVRVRARAIGQQRRSRRTDD